jgi:O-antigen/teichoic acid export membrane protein
VPKVTKSDFVRKILDAFLGQGLYIGLTMLFSLICTRLYGPEVFGEFTYAFTIVTIVMIFAKGGLDNGLIYFIPKNKNKFISLSLLINFLLSITLVLVLFLFIKDNFIRFMLPLIWLVSMEQLFFSIYRAGNKIREYYFINSFIAIFLRIIITIMTFYVINDNAYSIGIAVYASFIIANLIYLTQNKSKLTRINYDSNFIKYSFPLVFAAIMGVLIDKIDILMIGYLLDERSVGIYQIVSQIAYIVSIILVGYNTVFAPKISNLFHNGRVDDLKRLYIISTRILGVISLITFLGISSLNQILLSFFGPEITEGGMALIIRAGGQLVNAGVGSVWFMLAMTGSPKLQMYTNIFAFIMNIILNFALIPKYGINGAAFASMVAITFTNVVGYIVVSRQFKVKVFKFF